MNASRIKLLRPPFWKLVAGYALLALAFPIAVGVAFFRARRRAIARIALARSRVAAARPIPHVTRHTSHVTS